MHLEKRKSGKNRKYYLARSYRDGQHVRKTRIYLGQNLDRVQIGKRYGTAKKKLEKKHEKDQKINDPFIGNVDLKEFEEFTKTRLTLPIRIEHLNPKDWLTFTEEFTYETNAIEGSTLAQSEVRNIIEKDLWPEKPIYEIAETYGVARAIEYIRHTQNHLSIALIMELHQIVFRNSKSYAGQLRPPGIEVIIADRYGNVVHRGAPAKEIKERLNALVRWYQKNRRKYPPLVLAAVVHNQFENIHPFQDGNGRVGRLLLNNILLKNGLPPLNIELANRQEYYASLQAYENQHDLRPTLDLMLKEYGRLKKMLKKGRNSSRR